MHQTKTVVSILGMPGAGKTTHAKRIVDRMGSESGVLLESSTLISNRGLADPIFAKICAGYKSVGQLLPDHDTCEAVIPAIQRELHSGKVPVLSGFPRTIVQAKRMLSLVKASFMVFHFVVDDDEAVRRITSVEGKKERGERSDDSITVVKNRIASYHSDTAPVIRYFIAARERVTYNRISTMQPMSLVERQVMQILASMPSRGMLSRGFQVDVPLHSFV